MRWFLDDGCLYGEAEAVVKSLPAIEANLKAAHLELNHRKCEVYSFEPDSLPEGLRHLTCEPNPLEWSYLGAPLWGCGSAALKAANRANMVDAVVAKFGGKHPLQAMQLLRYTAGAGRPRLAY